MQYSIFIVQWTETKFIAQFKSVGKKYAQFYFKNCPKRCGKI